MTIPPNPHPEQVEAALANVQEVFDRSRGHESRSGLFNLSDIEVLIASLANRPADDGEQTELRRLRAACQDIADAEPIPNDAVAFVWCRNVARAALPLQPEGVKRP